MLPDCFDHVALTREEDGVGVCAGAFLAGGRPAMVIQSSGFGNMLNALMSLSRTYGFPLPIIASWRGVYNEVIPAQVPFNRPLPRILDALEIPYVIVNGSGELGKIGEIIQCSFEEHTPGAALVSPRCFEGVGSACGAPWGDLPGRSRPVQLTYNRTIREPVLSRYDAIRVIAQQLHDEAVVSNIGLPGKELFAARDRPLNFYMLGSYTQASPIGLGISLKTNRDVFVLDGDGSLLGSGILPVIASRSPGNLTIFCLDNGTFGSTGNQPTPAYEVADIELLAIASGFRRTCKAQTEDELAAAIEERGAGPNFIHVIIRPGNADVANIPLPPTAIRDRFMAALSPAGPMCKK
jgi:sulfopyruvate decarboxylase subunit beta